jgi:hypothetical protein
MGPGSGQGRGGGEDTYNEEVGDLGTSGRGGNVGGLSGPSGGLGVGGFGSQQGVNDAISNYESDPSGWNSSFNNYAGLDGPVDNDTFANWLSSMGVLSQVGAGQKGALDDVRSWTQDNPAFTSFLNTALYAANPVAGMLGSLFTSTLSGHGAQSLGSTLGGLFGGTPGSIAGGFLGGLADGKSMGSAVTGLASSAVGYGLGAAGLGLGSTLNSAIGNSKGSWESAITNSIGNMAQSAAIGYGAGAVGNAVASAPAGQSSLATGVANTGSAISSEGFNLAGGLDNNGGTGSFDLNKGIVGGGLSALGAFLLSGNNNMASNTAGDLGGLAASLYGQYGDKYSGNLQTIAGQMDPSQYNALLSESYANPTAVYDRQYAPMDKQFYGEMMANDSAAGRTSDAYKHGLAREAQFQKFLNEYRTGLSNTAQGRFNAYGNLMKGAADNTQGLKNTTANALSKVVGGTGSGGLGSLFSSAAGGIGNGVDYLANLFSSGADQNPSANDNYVQYPYPEAGVADNDWSSYTDNSSDNYVTQEQEPYYSDNPFVNNSWY